MTKAETDDQSEKEMNYKFSTITKNLNSSSRKNKN